MDYIEEQGLRDELKKAFVVLLKEKPANATQWLSDYFNETKKSEQNIFEQKTPVQQPPSREEMKMMFDEADKTGDGVLCVDDFSMMLKEKSNYTTVEISRLLKNLDKNKDGTLCFDEFQYGMRTGHLLSTICSDYSPPQVGVPADYNFEQSTNDNYKAADLQFHGDFVEARAQRDYSYHVNYTKQRQLWQDSLIKDICGTTSPSRKRPWLVYTCGPPGAGKSYALSWMSSHGHFPLDQIVSVDPDRIKACMPEWEAYKEKRGDEAAALCHRESGFLAEMVQVVAMQRKQTIWIDGTLKFADYFKKIFKEYEDEYPEYRIAIFKVSAPEEVLRERIKKRAEKTGRDVPDDVFEEALVATEKSLAVLTPFVKFVARISNAGGDPELEMFNRIDTSKKWSKISKFVH